MIKVADEYHKKSLLNFVMTTSNPETLYVSENKIFLRVQEEMELLNIPILLFNKCPKK